MEMESLYIVAPPNTHKETESNPVTHDSGNIRTNIEFEEVSDDSFFCESNYDGNSDLLINIKRHERIHHIMDQPEGLSHYFSEHVTICPICNIEIDYMLNRKYDEYANSIALLNKANKQLVDAIRDKNFNQGFSMDEMDKESLRLLGKNEEMSQSIDKLDAEYKTMTEEEMHLTMEINKLELIVAKGSEAYIPECSSGGVQPVESCVLPPPWLQDTINEHYEDICSMVNEIQSYAHTNPPHGNSYVSMLSAITMPPGESEYGKDKRRGSKGTIAPPSAMSHKTGLNTYKFERMLQLYHQDMIVTINKVRLVYCPILYNKAVLGLQLHSAGNMGIKQAAIPLVPESLFPITWEEVNLSWGHLGSIIDSIFNQYSPLLQLPGPSSSGGVASGSDVMYEHWCCYHLRISRSRILLCRANIGIDYEAKPYDLLHVEGGRSRISLSSKDDSWTCYSKKPDTSSLNLNDFEEDLYENEEEDWDLIKVEELQFNSNLNVTTQNRYVPVERDMYEYREYDIAIVALAMVLVSFVLYVGQKVEVDMKDSDRLKVDSNASETVKKDAHSSRKNTLRTVLVGYLNTMYFDALLAMSESAENYMKLKGHIIPHHIFDGIVQKYVGMANPMSHTRSSRPSGDVCDMKVLVRDICGTLSNINQGYLSI